MANIRIPCLIPRTNKGGITSWYWQPSATLARAGWKPLALGKDEGAAIAAARARNAEVAAWKGGGAIASAAKIKQREQTGTLAHLITRYERDVLNGKTPAGKSLIADSTARTYRTSLKKLKAWGGKHPLAFITPARVRALRDAMLAAPHPTDPAKGGIGHHAAHQCLKMGRNLFGFAEEVELIPRGSNPFWKFKLAAPPPRDVIWSPLAREAMMAAAHDAGMPSLALAIMLGFAIGQREGDILSLTQRKYLPLAEHQCRPEDYATLAAAALDGVPHAITVKQHKTSKWIAVPVRRSVCAAMDAAILRAKAAGSMMVLLDDTRADEVTGKTATYRGISGQSRFQRDFAEIRIAAALQASKDGESELAEELATLKFLDLRRTCVVYLGEMGMDAHQIAAITGHDIDSTQRILETYMPMTTGRAASTIALIERREQADAAKKEQANG